MGPCTGATILHADPCIYACEVPRGTAHVHCHVHGVMTSCLAKRRSVAAALASDLLQLRARDALQVAHLLHVSDTDITEV